MRLEIVSQEPKIIVRRLILEPGDAMPWHTDPCRRLTVVVKGERLAIEDRSTGQRVPVAVSPGMAAWDEPEPAEHRGVNTSSLPYEEVVVFFLPADGADPQPGMDSAA